MYIFLLEVRSLNWQKEDSQYSIFKTPNDLYITPDKHVEYLFYYNRLEGLDSDRAFSHSPLDRDFLVSFAMKLFAFLFVLPTLIACATLPPLELDGVADQNANSAQNSCVSECSVHTVLVDGKGTEACIGIDSGCTSEDNHYVQENLDKRGKTVKKPKTSEAKITPKKTTSSSKTTALKTTATQAESTPITTSSVKTSSQVETTLKSQTTMSKSSSQSELSSPKSIATTSFTNPSSTQSTAGTTPASTSSGAITASVSSSASDTASGAACNIQRAPTQKVLGKPFTGAKNTIMSYEVDCKAKVTTTHQTIITSLVYPNNLAPTQVTAACKTEYGQACYHYSSVIANNKQWATLTCPEAAATSANDRKDTGIVDKWSTSRNGKGWIDPGLSSMSPQCDRDEYPPVYLIDPSGSVAKDRGTSKAGQRLRVLPKSENTDAAKMWTGICFTNALPNSDAAVIDAAANKQAGGVKRKNINPSKSLGTQNW